MVERREGALAAHAGRVDMAKVTGIGGVFFESADPERLRRWFRDPGIDASRQGFVFPAPPRSVARAAIWPDTGHWFPAAHDARALVIVATGDRIRGAAHRVSRRDGIAA